MIKSTNMWRPNLDNCPKTLIERINKTLFGGVILPIIAYIPPIMFFAFGGDVWLMLTVLGGFYTIFIAPFQIGSLVIFHNGLKDKEILEWANHGYMREGFYPPYSFNISSLRVITNHKIDEEKKMATH